MLRGSKILKPPLFLVVCAGLTGMAIALPLIYLVIRVANVGGEQLWGLVSRTRTLLVLFNSVGLAFVTTIMAGAIARTLAFLTIRTDLPWRRFWLIVTTLPLAIPDYIGGFALIAAFGPKGSWLQIWLEPLGVEQLPEIYGWTGAILGLTLFSYPYKHPVSRFVAKFVTQGNFIRAKSKGNVFKTEIGDFVKPNQDVDTNERGDLMIREEDLILQPSPEGTVIIETRQFLGSEYRYSLRTNQGNILHARAPTANPLSIGTRVQLSVVEQRWRFFPHD